MKTSKFFHFIILIVLLLITNNGCKKDEKKDEAKENYFKPVSITGSIAFPGSPDIDFSRFTVTAGVFSRTNPGQSGNFSIDLNENATQLVTAIQANNNPMFLGIAVNPTSSMTFDLNPSTTAAALIFLNPSAIVADPELSMTMLEVISGLPATSDLADILTLKLKEDPDVLIKEDTQIQEAIVDALKEFNERVDQLYKKSSGNTLEKIRQFRNLKHFDDPSYQTESLKTIQVGDLVVSPVSDQSGIGLTATEVGNDKYKLTLTNGKKRYINVFLDDAHSGSNIGNMLLPSRKSLLSLAPLQPYERDLPAQLDLASHPSSTLYAYGLGAGKLDALLASPDWQTREITPVVLTGVFDFAVPLMQVVTGIRSISLLGNFDNPGGVLGEIIAALLSDPAYLAQMGIKIGVGEYTGALVYTVVKTMQIIVNNPAYLMRFLEEQGAAVLLSFVQMAVIPLRIGFLIVNGFELGAAVYDFATSSWVESWSLTKLGSIEGNWYRLEDALRVNINGQEGTILDFGTGYWPYAHQQGFLEIGDNKLRNITSNNNNTWNCQNLWMQYDSTSGSVVVLEVAWSTDGLISLSPDSDTLYVTSSDPWNGTYGSSTFTRINEKSTMNNALLIPDNKYLIKNPKRRQWQSLKTCD